MRVQVHLRVRVHSFGGCVGLMQMRFTHADAMCRNICDVRVYMRAHMRIASACAPSLRICVRISACTVRVDMHVRICVCICGRNMRGHLRVHMLLCMRMRMRMRMRCALRIVLGVHVHVQAHVYICICICMCMCVRDVHVLRQVHMRWAY